MWCWLGCLNYEAWLSGAETQPTSSLRQKRRFLAHGIHRFFNFYFYLFIYFWLCWVVVAACRQKAGSPLWCGVLAFSLWWRLLLWSTGSRCRTTLRHEGHSKSVVLHTLKKKVFIKFVTILLLFYVFVSLVTSSLHQRWTLPALEGEVLTTRLPGKSLKIWS